MHKFIVNNRIRLDPVQIQQATNNATASFPSSSAAACMKSGHLNAVLKLKMALPLIHARDSNNNQSTGSSGTSSSISDPSNSSRGSASKGDASPPEKVPTQIRMSGYLKKKRNRVGGGWRKLWFVLQNQLLVSYSSKEHYEKKLAPFKDLINLVPGTIIKPAPGARFTIETTANVVYTFRCENNKVCSDWITAICECLGIKSRRRSIPSLTSQKWSLNRTTRRVPKLPMAKNTARILQKGIIYEPIDHIAKVQQDFRLHSADLVLNATKSQQSSAVTRINRMFDVETQPARNSGISVTHKKATSSSSSAEREGSPSGRISKGHNNSNITCSGSGILRGRPVRMETLPECDDIEEQMQCITLEDTSLFSIQSNEEDTLDAEDVKERLLPTSPDSAGEPIYAVIDLKEKYQRRAQLNKQTGESTSSSTPPSSTVTAEYNVSPTDQRPSSPGYASIQRHHLSDYNNSSSSSGSNAKNVLVVDHRESSKIRSGAAGLALDQHQQRPKSFQLYSSGAGDYEEVLHFSHMKFSEPNSSADEDEIEENIYEPINIPEEQLTRGVHAGHKNLWSYFPKINFDAIMDGMGKRRHPNINTATSSSSSSSVTTSSSSSAAATGSFSEMRKKLGSHRKSIKNRVKRMYNRSATDRTAVAAKHLVLESITALDLSSHDDDDNSSTATQTNQSPTGANNNNHHQMNSSSPSPSPPPLPSVHLPKRDRNLFSLSRLRKSRTTPASTCHEDDDQVPEQKRQFVSPEDGDDPEKKKNVCHSKFYDNDNDDEKVAG